MTWMKLRFRLTGSLHIGGGRWGYMRRGRPYLPGWTLWGALTNFCTRRGLVNGEKSFTVVGEYLNNHFWFGHLELVYPTDDGDEYFLPELEPNTGRTVYRWWRPGKNPAATDRFPLAFRAGVARGRPDNNPLGRHFLTETISSDVLDPYFLEGCYYRADEQKLPLAPGHRLPVGGNRQTSGAVITLTAHEEIDDIPDLRRLSHVQLPEDAGLQVAGAVERLVMRRTREGEGFGRCFVDWKRHAAPGWRHIGAGDFPVQPARDDDGYHHGTVAPAAAETENAGC